MHALIVKKHWLDKIFHNKSCELRSKETKITGKIALIQSGSSRVYGETNIIHCVKIQDEAHFNSLRKFHQYNGTFQELKDKFGYKNVYGWMLENSYRYQETKLYRHPMGAVIWVKNIESRLV